MTLPEDAEAERYVDGLTDVIDRAPRHLPISSIRSALEASGRATFTVDLEGAGGKAGILEAFATALDFPGWFGWNWDALDDAMRDLSWLSSGEHGRALLVCAAEGTSAGSQAELAVLRDVLDDAATSWLGTDTPLVVVYAASRGDEVGLNPRR